MDTLQQLIEMLINKHMLCKSIPIQGFPPFYFILGANLGLRLHEDVSVMKLFN